MKIETGIASEFRFTCWKAFDLFEREYLSSSANCELLCVYKEDFDEVLRETMETKHENIKTAVRRFEYFKNFTDEKV